MAADRRGTSTERGYGARHKRERARVRALVEAGQAYCSYCGRWIEPGSAWHLGHDHLNGGYDGPQHASCNVRERNRRHARRSRDWW